MSGDYTVGDYLLARLAEIGVRHLFGVPGDYNMAFLDHAMAHDRISWVGNTNELNAAYAADGYARVNGAGALLTTYGVGELSAINGIAGAYAEYVPVIHIVGAPSTAAERTGAMLHHTLGDGDYRHFIRAHAEVTVAQAYLSAGNAVAEIDRVLATSRRERRPGYLSLPTDVAVSPAEPPAGPLVVPAPEASARVLARFTDAARTLLAEAGTLGVLADFLADRFGVRSELADLVAAGQIPNATLSMGKGVLDESAPEFVGTYSGAFSTKRVLAAVEQADVLLSVGVRFSDSTTGLTHRIDPDRTIDIQPFATYVGEQVFAPLPMRDAVRALTGLVTECGRSWARSDLPPVSAGELTDDVSSDSADTLRHSQLWPAIQRFLRPGDIVLAELGTSLFGAQGMRLPAGAAFIGQPLWASIGYTLPATLGAQLAAPGRRTVLLIGDGSAQVTAQEIGTLLREGCTAIVLLINNGRYTIENALHGGERRYNDIHPWNWTLLPAAMGGESVTALRASTPAELSTALARATDPADLVLLEAVLPPADLPDVLLRATARSDAAAHDAEPAR
ncbi:alpha-keto acid decarboxylase family protein [Streptomyces gibsoniae]|uniref:Alpha-keto-acid decarboxylase n=1 Tax=Streptomyces gibsoniae TaxID=3075529 RepID=A0ABU2U8A4_9ACTN|nr:alpha-keto acid decarboxylase family protein [Streptomyces sp. DSM 41699]MDT0469261.1 alpha-keto acid decarboxylase family protein [Streptomyces sp. DSM 41699]